MILLFSYIFIPKDLDVSGFIPNFALLIPGSLCFFKLSGLFFSQIYSAFIPLPANSSALATSTSSRTTRPIPPTAKG